MHNLVEIVKEGKTRMEHGLQKIEFSKKIEHSS
jgi:hypothetical protein